MISVVILAKNEEKDIQRCLESVKWCDEIIVIDDYSSDKTLEIAKKIKATVYKQKLQDFSTQRNFAISKTRGDWILFVDSDEIISDALAFEISNVINQLTDRTLSSFNGFIIRRKDFIWGRELSHGESGSTKLLRLAKKGKGEWKGEVHEKWKIEGKIGVLNNPIIHYPHQAISEFLKEINFYTSVRAQELHSKKIRAYWWSIIFFPIGKFIVNYFYRKGFLDGIEGLVFAITMSFHSFLVRGKLWTMNKNE